MTHVGILGGSFNPAHRGHRGITLAAIDALVLIGEDPNVDRQPILLTTAGDNPNHAQALFLIDGAEPGSLDGYERCILLFDGRDAPATEAARERWRAFKAEGRSASYWRQGTERGWEKQA